MAKLTGAMLSLGASGTIGKTITFASWRGKKYARQHVIPHNPRTAAQTGRRGVFRNCSYWWKTADAQFDEAWMAYASGQPFTDRNGFVRSEMKALTPGSGVDSFVFSPGAGGAPPPTNLVLTGGSGSIAAAVDAPVIPTGWTLDGVFFSAIPYQVADGAVPLPLVATFLDTTSTYSHTFSGLTHAIEYFVGAWARYTKPDGSKAYSPSISGGALTT